MKRQEKLQEKARQIVDNEIFCLVNSEVEYILRQDDYSNAPYSWEDVENAYNEETEEYAEIMQWYKVSDWLVDILGDMGEPVIRDYCIWGRCGCGYSTEDDMYRVAEYLEEKGILIL